MYFKTVNYSVVSTKNRFPIKYNYGIQAKNVGSLSFNRPIRRVTLFIHATLHFERIRAFPWQQVFGLKQK